MNEDFVKIERGKKIRLENSKDFPFTGELTINRVVQAIHPTLLFYLFKSFIAFLPLLFS